MPEVTDRVDTIRINAPEFFQDKEFAAYLNGSDSPATWHPKESEPGEYSDVFLVHDHGEISERGYMPDHICDQIAQICKEQGHEYGLVWLTNL